MGKTIIINEEQLSNVTRIDEVIGGTMDKLKDAFGRAKMGYQDDKARNKRIMELRFFVDELYLIYGDKNGTIDKNLYQAVRKAVSKRIWQIQYEIKNHGLNFDGKGNGSGNENDAEDFFATKDNLEAWKRYFGRDYTEEYLGKELYNAFEKCLRLEVGSRSDLFYIVDKVIKPKMFELSRAKGFPFNG